MGDGWEIENSSSEKVQSGHSNARCHSVSLRRNSEGSSQELSKFDFDFKSTRRFSERNDISHHESILLSDSETASSLQDVKLQRAQNRDSEILLSSCGFFEDNLVRDKIYCSKREQGTTTVKEKDEPLKFNSYIDMERETKLENISLVLKYQPHNENAEVNNGSQRNFFYEKNKDLSDLSLEGKANSHGAVKSSTVSSIAACCEELESTETNSAELIMQNKPPRLQEKDHSKRRISFRALVRMKGLGRRMRKKHQTTKKREKYSNHRNESGQIKEFKSYSSSKNLLESSTSTSEEQTCSHMKIAPRKKEPARSLSLQRSQSLNQYKADTICPNSDEVSCSSSEISCSSGYLERRRRAVCEELEKTLLCGEQSLADLRAILVVQQKLTGFGLL